MMRLMNKFKFTFVRETLNDDDAISGDINWSLFGGVDVDVN